MKDPVKDFNTELEKAIAFHGTRYKASKIIGTRTDEAFTTVHSRLRKWGSKELSESIVKLITDLDSLGFEIEIKTK
jgi:cell division ATPase FtsA